MSSLQKSNREKATGGKGISAYLLWLIWIIWLPFLYPAFVEMFQAHPPVSRLIAYLAGITLFIVIYMWATLRIARNLVTPTPPSTYALLATWLPVGIMIVLSLVLTPGYGRDWFDMFIFTCAYVGGCQPMRRAALVIAGIALTIVLSLVIRFHDYNPFDILQLLIFSTVVGAVTMIMVRSVITARELRAAREEITRLAVTTERLRIARDLHDLLGHNLSLIALKSELAGRLVTIAPERAAVEISDVEQVARTTLQEVREAVSAYRQPTITSELHAAQELLAAAGIAFGIEGDEKVTSDLPPAIEAVLAWTIREGVTNVIRHSHARHCTIRVTRTDHEASVEIVDDGANSSVLPLAHETPVSAGSGGSGLHGLAERVSALGGCCEVGPLPSSGFRLAVVVPRAEKRRIVGGAGEQVTVPPGSTIMANQDETANKEAQERSGQQ